MVRAPLVNLKRMLRLSETKIKKVTKAPQRVIREISKKNFRWNATFIV